MKSQSFQIYSLLILFLLLNSCGIQPQPDTTNSSPNPITPMSSYENEPYSPHLDIRKVKLVGNRVEITICFDFPTDRNDWTMGRLYGDVYISDGTHTAILSGFTLESMSEDPSSAVRVRCDRSAVDIPTGFHIEQAILTVERIAAAIPNNIDWDAVIQLVEEIAPGIVWDPIVDQPGPGFSIDETPPGMTALEAHDLILGVIEPVVIGPWSIPIETDLQ